MHSMKQESQYMPIITLILTIVFTFLLTGCRIENTKDQALISEPPQTSSSTPRPLPQPTQTRSQIPTATALPSPTPISSPTSKPIVTVFAPQLWSDDASYAITTVSASDSSWKWQLISDEKGHVVVCASTVEKAMRTSRSKNKMNNMEVSDAVGKLIAERALHEGIKKVAFDRSGFKYHGRVKALAEGARSGGLEF